MPQIDVGSYYHLIGTTPAGLGSAAISSSPDHMHRDDFQMCGRRPSGGEPIPVYFCMFEREPSNLQMFKLGGRKGRSPKVVQYKAFEYSEN